MVTVQDVVSFLKEYGFGPVELITLAVARFLRDRIVLIRAFLSWLGQAKHPLLAASAIIAAVVTTVMAKRISPGNPEVVIRHTGLALLLLGTLTVIIGATKTRKDFKLPSLWHQAWLWLKRCPLLRQHGEFKIGGVTCRVTVGALDAYGIHGIGENPTIESLAEVLIKNVQNLHERINGVRKELDGKIRETNTNIEGMDKARKEDARNIRKELLETATGGLLISVIGAIWLIVGSILGTAAPELAKLL